MKKIILFSFCMLLILSCSGMYKATEDRGLHVEDNQHVIYKDTRLIPSVTLIKTESIPIGKLMKVRAKFRNVSSYQIQAEYKIKFLDSSGYTIDDNQGWQPFILEEGETKSLQRVSPKPSAKDYRILLQYAN